MFKKAATITFFILYSIILLYSALNLYKLHNKAVDDFSCFDSTLCQTKSINENIKIISLNDLIPKCEEKDWFWPDTYEMETLISNTPDLKKYSGCFSKDNQDIDDNLDKPIYSDFNRNEKLIPRELRLFLSQDKEKWPKFNIKCNFREDRYDPHILKNIYDNEEAFQNNPINIFHKNFQLQFYTMDMTGLCLCSLLDYQSTVCQATKTSEIFLKCFNISFELSLNYVCNTRLEISDQNKLKEFRRAIDLEIGDERFFLDNNHKQIAASIRKYLYETISLKKVINILKNYTDTVNAKSSKVYTKNRNIKSEIFSMMTLKEKVDAFFSDEAYTTDEISDFFLLKHVPEQGKFRNTHILDFTKKFHPPSTFGFSKFMINVYHQIDKQTETKHTQETFKQYFISQNLSTNESDIMAHSSYLFYGLYKICAFLNHQDWF